MSTLEDLFPGGRAGHDSPPVFDDTRTARQLEERFGDRRDDLERTHRASERSALIALVNDATADARPLVGNAPTAGRGAKRPRRRIDIVNVALASIAAVAVAGAALVGGVQAATASPAADALGVLAADEKAVHSALAGFDAARTRAADSVAEMDAAAAALRPSLMGVRDAPDPAAIPEGETEAPEEAEMLPIADAEALDTVLAALDAYRADLAAVAPPEAPAPYERAEFDADNLSEVGAAIDAVQLKLNETDDAMAALRASRDELSAKQIAFGEQLAAFSATFPGVAKAAVDANVDAAQELKDAVTAAAAAVSRADLLTESGASTLAAYRDAVVALVADQVAADRQREREEQERLEQEERERQQQGSGGSQPEEPQPPSGGGTPTTPPEDTSPPEPTEPPAETEPTSPPADG